MSAPARPAAATAVGPHAISDLDLHLFCEGTHARIYEKLGAHMATRDGVAGTEFAVWAPSARAVSVIGDFNAWKPRATPLARLGPSGIWSGFVRGVGRGDLYKYRIVAPDGQVLPDKADPYGAAHQAAPHTASVVWHLDYTWQDQRWMTERAERDPLRLPLSVYQVHLSSWMRVPENGHRSLSYVELAPRLVDYVKRLGATHVELLPVMDSPSFDAGLCQATGYFAPSTRYGSPQDFMALIDTLHQHGIGVILSWPLSRFRTAGHGLIYFDGTHLYERPETRQREHSERGGAPFDYERLEVQSFLTSNAFFWLEKYHADGIRVDGVTSILHLDQERAGAHWLSDARGRREAPGAVAFLQRLNDAIHREYPDALTIADETTARPRVTAPTQAGGLGFDLKWDVGWAHDTLQYLARATTERRFHHGELTFRRMYAYGERYLLPLAHAEVAAGKRSLLGKMPGDEWQKFANLRLLFAYMLATPGKKLIFMGGELGQQSEWNPEGSLEWHLAGSALARGVQQLVRDLNRVYAEHPALFARDHDPEGFDWIEPNDSQQSTLSFLRRSDAPEETVLAIFNFTADVLHDQRLGVEQEGFWHELINTDAKLYGGSGQGNRGGAQTDAVPSHGRPFSLRLTLPPLAGLLLSRG